jgi:hypothetical protein
VGLRAPQPAPLDQALQLAQSGIEGLEAAQAVAVSPQVIGKLVTVPAPAIAALLGDGNHWITGQRIEVSGGQNL